MRVAVAGALIALLASGCGGGGSSSSNLGNTQPQGQSVTYSGQFFNSSGQPLGTATVKVVGTWLQATCVPSSNTGTTFLITGNLVGGNLISTGTPPTQIGTGSVSGTTLSLMGVSENLVSTNYGVISLVATQN